MVPKEEDVKCETDELCNVVKRFVWLGEVQDAEELVVSSICPELEGNSCSTFGVGLLSYENDREGGEEERRICHASRVTSVPIQSFVEFRVWTVGETGWQFNSINNVWAILEYSLATF